jgi:hypothetical protein
MSDNLASTTSGDEMFRFLRRLPSLFEKLDRMEAKIDIGIQSATSQLARIELKLDALGSGMTADDLSQLKDKLREVTEGLKAVSADSPAAPHGAAMPHNTAKR